MYFLSFNHCGQDDTLCCMQAPIVSSREYQSWREGGVAFCLRDDAPYDQPNLSLVSGLLLMQVAITQWSGGGREGSTGGGKRRRRDTSGEGHRRGRGTGGEGAREERGYRKE